MFGGVKITLILCATMIVCCVLFISYNEYTNRYSLLTTNENSVYIFDKKSTTLNKCDAKGCSVIETKLPTKMEISFAPAFQQSKMFGNNQPMTQSINEKIPESPAPKDETTTVNPQEPAKTVEAKPVENNTKPETAKQPEAQKPKNSNSNSEKDDEFVE